jgi:voltage-gated potassium channel Kch
LLLLACISSSAILVAALLIQLTDPERFPNFGTGLWWAVTTVTTVGYGDVVPASVAGRLIGGCLMFVGIGSIAFLTAVAASAIVVGEVSAEEREIQREESEILSRLEGIDQRLRDIEQRFDNADEHRPPRAKHIGPEALGPKSLPR